MMLNLQWKISQNASETIPTLFKFLQNTWKTLKYEKLINIVKNLTDLIVDWNSLYDFQNSQD